MGTATLVCGGCGANLAFEPGQDRAVCAYCGTQSVLVAEKSEPPPAARTVAGHSPAFFEAALAEADPGALKECCDRYVEGARAYVETGQTPAEEMLRAVEETIDITEEGKDEFRRGIMNFVGALKIEGKQLEYSTSDKFHRALAGYLYLQKGSQ